MSGKVFKPLRDRVAADSNSSRFLCLLYRPTFAHSTQCFHRVVPQRFNPGCTQLARNLYQPLKKCIELLGSGLSLRASGGKLRQCLFACLYCFHCGLEPTMILSLSSGKSKTVAASGVIPPAIKALTNAPYAVLSSEGEMISILIGCHKNAGF